MGARVWNLLQEPRSVQEIWGIRLSEFEVAPQRGERDLLKLRQELSAEGLIEVKDDKA